MSFDYDTVIRNGGQFSVPWLLATGSNKKIENLSRITIDCYDIRSACIELEKLIPSVEKHRTTKKISLYITSQLVYGLVLVLDRKLIYLEADVQTAYESFIRVSNFENIKTSAASSKIPKRGRKLKATKVLEELELNLDETFHKALDIPDLLFGISKPRMEDITLKETQYKDRLIFDSIDDQSLNNLSGEDWCAFARKNKECLKDICTPSAKQLINDEISLFSKTTFNSSLSSINSQEITAQVSSEKTSNENMLIELPTNQEGAMIQNNPIDLDFEPMKIFTPFRNSREKESPLNTSPIIKPICETPKRRPSGQSNSDFELSSIQIKRRRSGQPVKRKRQLIVDEDTQLTKSEMREYINNYADTMSNPSKAKITKSVMSTEELLNVVPPWYPKNSFLTKFFNSRIQNPGTFFESNETNHLSDIERGKSQSFWRFESSQKYPESQKNVINSQSMRSPGYCFARETPEPNGINIQTIQEQSKGPVDHSMTPLEISRNVNIWNESQKFDNTNTSVLITPIRQTSLLFGSKIGRTAKDRIITVLYEVGPDCVFFSTLFPARNTSRKTAAAAFQSVLELLKERKIEVQQSEPFCEIRMKLLS